MQSKRPNLLARLCCIAACLVILAILACCVQLGGKTLIAQERATGAATSLIDVRKVIDGLRNRNAEPRMIRGDVGFLPLFDEKYDWSEYDRVVRTIRLLKCRAEDAWPELLMHFDDGTYCVSTASEAYETGQNHTVGLVCQEIVRGYLRAGYSRHLHTLRLDKPQYMAIRSPAMLRDPATLKTWCEKRSEKKLYELQVEMCEWAIDEAATLPVLASERAAFVDAVRVEIAALNSSQTPVGYRWLGEGIGATMPFDAAEAKKIRERQATAPSDSEGQKGDKPNSLKNK